MIKIGAMKIYTFEKSLLRNLTNRHGLQYCHDPNCCRRFRDGDRVVSIRKNKFHLKCASLLDLGDF